MKNDIYLGLGSNIGDRSGNIISALSLLQSSGYVNITGISSFYETSPVGPRQPSFYNIAVKAKTSLVPLDLLALVKQAETLLGRKPSNHWGPRAVDIDILFYNNEIINKIVGCSISSIFNASLFALPLTIPHKEIQNRLFVLYPLNEIAAGFTHPVLNRKINAILKTNRLTLKDQKVKIITI